ncbi:MAG: choice-of-anchor T family protein [Candidatus Poseidoniaceae archaeon]|nr:choice-of-anchor T family protein [Candidatus Poseidoniaceae archaeon]
MLKRSFPLLILALFLLPLVSFSSAQDSPLPGVTIDCESNPELNVHPLYNEPVELICIITNTSSLEETIEISNDFEGGAMVQIQGASDEYTVAGGEEEQFTVTFTGDTKIPSTESYDFEIIATVTQWLIPGSELPEIVQANASAIGKVEIGTYGIVELEIGDKSTRAMEPSDEVTINFQFTNKGNDEDRIRVEIKNKADLETLGFSFPLSSFVADDLPIDGTSIREIVIRAPSDVSDKISTNIQFEASSTNDPDAPVSAISIPVSVESSSSSGSGTLTGLSEDSQDDMILYGAIGGGVILFFILVGIITRSIKKKPSAESGGVEQAIDLTEEDEGGIITDELDDLFEDLDDFDDIGSSEDEFDDLLDDFE